MKHLCYKVREFLHRFFFRLSVILTLGIRDEKENNCEDVTSVEDTSRKENDHEEN